MPSQVSIFNLALGKLGNDVSIAAPTDRSKEARAFARLWEPMRDLVLAERNWPWAIKALRLAPDAEAPLPGWTYRYARPADCITAIAVTDDNGLRTVRRLSRWCHRENVAAYMHDFEQCGGEQGTCLLSDLPQAWLVYVSRVEDPQRYPAKFVDALACKLAEEAAPSLIGDKGLNAKTGLKQLYQLALSTAAAHDFNESNQDAEPMSALQASRI
ncbi:MULTISPECIES: hypothetical protein [unclassified Xanthomonas]|uniref:hypothetical protein n=1 Tax=unclassified Xanthomonas TaxID=2643310 RepID=UPI002A7EDBE5|nr:MULTISPECIES: hypothetical protein [unclassified Xanthomonas]MDY4297517.1 hypothetical protein [Xanthomonas sp. LF02-5]MDY4359311.1 hypothetical protein [Xanthomonas sp. LF04-12]